MTYFLIRMTNAEGTWWSQGANRWCDTTADARVIDTEADAQTAAAQIQARLEKGTIWDWQPRARVKIIRFDRRDK